jgi:ribosomal protein S8
VVNDKVTDMLLRIRNAIAVKNKYVIVPKTSLTIGIAKILVSEGFIETFIIDNVYLGGKSRYQLCIFLKYRGCMLRFIFYILNFKFIS